MSFGICFVAIIGLIWFVVMSFGNFTVLCDLLRWRNPFDVICHHYCFVCFVMIVHVHSLLCDLLLWHILLPWQWRLELEDILELAVSDSDQWVAMIAEILRPFPSTGSLAMDVDDSNATFHEVLADLKKTGKLFYCGKMDFRQKSGENKYYIWCFLNKWEL